MRLFKTKLSLFLQRGLSWLAFPLIYSVLIIWMRFYCRYRYDNLKAIRKRYLDLLKKTPGPILFCPNHLTYIDSLLLAMALRPTLRYFLSFKTFPWNIPRREHVEDSWLYQVICYLGKCLLISRNSKQAIEVMNNAVMLLNKGQHFVVFPEGTRSKTGRINTKTFVYGIGGLVQRVDNLTVVSVYLRGDKQQLMSKMPEKNDTFYFDMKIITPQSDKRGLRGQRDIAQQIIQSLLEMETDYFENHRRQ